ncbi:potassium channel subfamily U member 1 isoform X2 [Pseudophryne corroboree]|uniref:potassium channel subfamily U member 1 isoform X2 n=1 Tax=Pseudophryne corroboree TaxID=495146 RepID=UPI003081ECD3
MSKWILHTHCEVEQKTFLISSAAVLLGGLTLILLWRIVQTHLVPWIKQRCTLAPASGQPTENEERTDGRTDVSTRVRHFVELLLSAQSFMGRVLVILVFVLSIGTVIIYFIISADPSEFCDYSESIVLMIDLGFNTFFVFYFVLRFIAADDKLKFWLELTSIVDFFTITPVFISVYLRKNWLGLRFLRALRLLELPKILQLLKITTTSSAIKLSNLLAVFLSCWLTAAGFIHLLENSGDPWLEDNVHHMDYFQCIYLLMVTFSTVGYGDTTAETTLGRIFIILSIIGGMVLFASQVPEIAHIVGSHKKYSGFHVVAGGRKILPTLELEALIKCNIQSTFFHGSVLDHKDLIRVKMENVDAVLVFANRYCSNPDHEDATNIRRVASIKTYYPHVRVITQILQTHNKAHVQNIPSWDWRIGDSILCLSELKLGFMAQGCLVPGLSTLLTNLCSMKVDAEVKQGSWQWHFLDGSSNSLMTEILSNAFVGMSFSDACRLCFVKMNIVLMAIEYRTSEGFSILVNPSAHVVLQENTTGFFIARSLADVQRASLYCSLCHANIIDPLLIRKCACKQRAAHYQVSDHYLLTSVRSRSLGVLPTSDYRPSTSEQKGSSNPTLDSTGMFHWCKAVPLKQATLTHQTAAQMEFQNHIVVSLFGYIGLQDFVMPLRTSNFSYQELKPVIFLGPLRHLRREWKSIQHFPKLFVFPGSGLSCANLRAVNIYQCSMCVVMSSNWTHRTKYLEDTECTQATRNVRSMQFKTRIGNTAALLLPSDGKEPVCRIPVITKLNDASNITFIQQEMPADHKRPVTNAIFTTAFASGSVFSASFLDCLMSVTYYSCNILPLLQTLVTGGSTPELEEQLADDYALKMSQHNTKHFAPQDRSKLSLIPLNAQGMSDINGNTYGELFCSALACGIICFGVYRLFDESNQCQTRYVIARPGKDFPLQATDLLYCLVPCREQTCPLKFGAEKSSETSQGRNQIHQLFHSSEILTSIV